MAGQLSALLAKGMPNKRRPYGSMKTMMRLKNSGGWLNTYGELTVN